MSAEGVEERGELPEVSRELLLTLTDILNAVIGGQVVKLTGQGSYIILKTLLHVVQSSHKRIMNSFLDVRAKFRKLRVQRIKIIIKARLHGIHALVHMGHHALKSGHPCVSRALAACSKSKDQNSLDQAARTAEAEEEVEEEASAQLHQLQEQLLHHRQLLPHHLGKE
jgi:Zn-dependent M16 (insulinase) family peptidase